ncbi:MAG: sialidase family protein [Anaerolineae bacterium]
MSSVRVLVGTRKGAFILTSDGKRETWDVSGPLFAGWEMYHLKGSPVDPNRLYASQSNAWFGQTMQRSDDGGKTWEPVGNKFAYDGDPGTHQWYDGTPHPWEFARVWHLEPSLTDPDTVYAGVQDAALFRSTDGGQTWGELPGLREAKGHLWAPGAGGMCLHTILLDPSNPDRIYVAISAAGAFRTDDAGQTWKPINHGLISPWELPDPDADVGHCVHNMAMHPSRPGVLFMQKHWDVMRSDNCGDSWHEISGNLPSDFGFPIAVHAHEPETVYVVPIKSDSEHYPPEGKLRVYRSRAGGNEWEALTNGLPQSNCFVNVLRDAMSVDTLDACGIYFGTTGGQVYVSTDAGDTWTSIVHDLPSVMSVEVQTLP